MNEGRVGGLAAGLVLVALCARGWGVDSPAEASPAVWARVGRYTVSAADVAHLLAPLIHREALSPQARRRAERIALEQCVARRCVELELDRLGFLVGEMEWSARWTQYVARQGTDDALRELFEREREAFDGSERRVSHILWAWPETRQERDEARLVEQAAAVRRELVAGRLTFDEGARRYSQGPSRDQGGELGWIERRGPMTEAFSRGAFALEPGGISEPIVSPHGVHLIRVNEQRRGTRGFEQVKPVVAEVFARRLFERLAESGRRLVKVEWLVDPLE